MVAEHGGDARPAVGVVVGHARGDRGQQRRDRFPLAPRRHHRDLRIHRREQCLDAAVVREVAVVETRGEVAAGRLVDAPVAAPVRDDQIHPAVAIEVRRGDAVPAAGDAGHTVRCGHIGELAAVVPQQADRAPVAGERQVGITVAIEVGENRAAHEADVGEGLGDHEDAAVVPQEQRCRRLRIPPGDGAPADEEVEVAIPVDIREHDRAGGVQVVDDRELGGGRCGTLEGRDVERCRIRVGVLPVRRAGDDADGSVRGPPHGDTGLVARIGRRHRSVGPFDQTAPAFVAEDDGAPGLAAGDDEVVGPVAVDIGPGDAGPEGAEPARKQRLPGEIVVGLVEVDVPDGRAHIAEQRRRPGDGGRRGPRRGLVDLVDAVRHHVVHDGLLAAAPDDLDGEPLGRARGEDAHRIVARAIAAACHHLLRLRDRAAEDLDLRADAAGVAAGAFQAHRDARRGRVVAEDTCRRVETVDDDIEVAVVVEVGQRHALRHARGVETPRGAGVFEGQVAAVAERHARHLASRHAPEELEALLRRPPRAGAADLGHHVRVLDVMVAAVGDEQVLPAVQVHVEEGGAPRPVGRRHAGERRDVGVGAVAAREVQRVARDFRAELRVGDRPGQDAVQGERPLPCARLPARAEHLGDEEVVEAVAVDVRGVDRHRRQTVMAEGGPRRGLEALAALVQPDAVRPIDEVVADVEVRQSVAVQVAEHRGQAPIRRCFLQRVAVLVEEHADVPRGGDEVAAALVHVELVAFAFFEHLGRAARVRESQETVARFDDRRAVGRAARGHPQAGRVVVDRVGAVMRDVQVEVAVAVDIGEGHRRGAGFLGELRTGDLGETTATVVEEGAGAGAETVDQQVEVAVPVDVGQRASGRELARARDAGRGGDLLELPASKVPVQDVPAVEPAEVDVHPAVAVDIAQGHARAVLEQAVGGDHRVGETVGEADAGVGRPERREARFPGRRDLGLGAAEPFAGLPDERRGREDREAGADDDGERHTCGEIAGIPGGFHGEGPKLGRRPAGGDGIHRGLAVRLRRDRRHEKGRARKARPCDRYGLGRFRRRSSFWPPRAPRPWWCRRP